MVNDKIIIGINARRMYHEELGKKLGINIDTEYGRRKLNEYLEEQRKSDEYSASIHLRTANKKPGKIFSYTEIREEASRIERERLASYIERAKRELDSVKQQDKSVDNNPTTLKNEEVVSNRNNELKDALYYSDLISEIKGLIYGRENINERIKLRKQDIESEENGVKTKRQSEYTKDLLEILERVKLKHQLGGDYISLLRDEIKNLMRKRTEAIFRDNPIVKEHPVPEKKFIPHESHNGFVEWQPISERYEVPGLMPRAPRKMHPKLTKKKKNEIY